MRININNPAIQPFQNNGLMKNSQLLFKPVNKTNQNAILNLSSQSVDQYFKNGVFKSPFGEIRRQNTSQSHSTYQNTNDTMDYYGKIYAEMHEKIMTHTPQEQQGEYLEKLEAAYSETIHDMAKGMADDIEKLFEKFGVESPLDEREFKELFKEIAIATKNYHLENETGDIATYIEKHVDFSKNPDIKSYDAFTKVMDLVDLSKNMTQKARGIKELFTMNSPDNLIVPEAFSIVNNHVNGLAMDLAMFSELKESLNLYELGEKFGKAFSQVMDKQHSNLTDATSKMQRYAEYLEKYKKLQEEIKEAEAKRDIYNQKLDKANQAKEEKLVGMYLKQVASMDAAIATLKAESAQIEAQMARLLKDIDSMPI